MCDGERREALRAIGACTLEILATHGVVVRIRHVTFPRV
jgi:hypothetical protein